MLLRVVADLQPVPRHHLAGVGLVDAAQDAQQGGLARAVEAEDDDARALVDREVDVGEDLQRPVGLRQLRRRQRGLAARRRGRELDPGDLVAATFGLDARHQPLGPLHHRLGGLGLGGLGPHLVRLRHQRVGLALGVEPLALAAAFVGLALGEVGRPAQVVDVDLGAVGVEVQHLVDDGLQQAGVVADHDQAAPVRLEEVAQPDDRVGVEVVGGLVEQQRLGAGEQDPRELDPAPLATGEGAQRLAEHPLLDPEAGRDLGCLRLGGVAAAGVQVRVRPLVPAHRTVADRSVVAAHVGLGLPQPTDDVVEAAGREDPLPGEHVGVAGAWVLRQVADAARGVHGAGCGRSLAGEDLGEGGLAGAVAADQADLVACRHAEADVLHQQPRPGSHLEVLGGDHQAR